MKFPFRDLIRRPAKEAREAAAADGYSRALQAARVRAAYQRSYFAPALFSLIPVATDLIDSMAVDAHWRLYYNDQWVAQHTVEENATLLIHEVGHLLRDHEARKKAAGLTDHRRWNTAGDCEINDDLHAEGLPLPGNPALPGKYGLESGNTAETYYRQLLGRRASGASEPRERSGPASGPRESVQGSLRGKAPQMKMTADRALTANGDSGNYPRTTRASKEHPASTA